MSPEFEIISDIYELVIEKVCVKYPDGYGRFNMSEVNELEQLKLIREAVDDLEELYRKTCSNKIYELLWTALNSGDVGTKEDRHNLHLFFTSRILQNSEIFTIIMFLIDRIDKLEIKLKNIVGE